jgi:putative lipoprotein
MRQRQGSKTGVSRRGRWIAALVLSTLAIALSSCAHTAGEIGGGGGGVPAPATGLAGTAWRVMEIAGGAADPTSDATLRFDSDHWVSGSTGCSKFTGSVVIEADQLTFAPLATTGLACAPELMAQEQNFLSAVQGVRRFAVDPDGRLQLLGVGGGALMRLTRTSP